MSHAKYPDWETLASNTIINQDGRTYHILEIPSGTYIYRGFCMPGEEKGLYYASLGVAFFYAEAADVCYNSGRIQTVQEYVTKEVIKLLDLNVWENLKYIMEDLGGDNVFEYTHGFNPDEKTELIRFAGDDEEMIEKVKEWLAMESSPKLNGFGAKEIKMIMDGKILKQPFHAEIACTTPSSLEMTNVYLSSSNSKTYRNSEDRNDMLEWVNMRTSFIDEDEDEVGGRREKKKTKKRKTKKRKTKKRKTKK
jgi:hypothetical protein